MSLKTALINVLFLSLLALGGWYWGSHPVSPTLSQVVLEQLPDLYIHNLQYHEYDTQGMMTKTLYTPLLTHIPYHNQFLLTIPHVHFKTHQEHDITLTAQQAFTEQNLDCIIFKDHVQLSQPATTQAAALTMSTQSLTYFRKTEKVSTTDQVRIQSQEHTVEAQGMEVDLTTQHMILFQAHATLAPKPHVQDDLH